MESEKEELKFSFKDYKVSFRIKVKNEKIEFYKKQQEQIQKTGEPLKFNTNDIDIDGFDILKDLITEANVTDIKFETNNTVKSSVTMLTHNNNNHLSTLLSPLIGKIQFTSEHFHFIGTLDDSPLELELNFNIENNCNIIEMHLSINVDFMKWNNKNILFLPHEEKLYNFFSDLKNNYDVELFLEIRGNTLVKAREKIFNIGDLADAFIKIHKFVYICKSLKYNIPFPDPQEVFKINNTDLETMFNLLKNGEYISSSDNYKISFSKKTSDNNYPFQRGMIIDKYESVRNIILELKDKKIILNNVNFQLLKYKIEDIISFEKNGVPFTRLNLKGTENSKIIHTYKHELPDKLL